MMNTYTREDLKAMGFEPWEIDLHLEGLNELAESYNKDYMTKAYVPTAEEIKKINAMLDEWENM